MRLFVGLTNGPWYRHLASHPELEEVNFWRPRAKTEFHALSAGDPLLFKLHYPERAICGVGWFAAVAAESPSPVGHLPTSWLISRSGFQTSGRPGDWRSQRRPDRISARAQETTARLAAPLAE